MASIRLRFIQSGGFVGRSIGLLTNSLFSHVEFGTPEGTWIGAHAGSGAQERPANYCTPRREYIYEVPATPFQVATLLSWARSQVGVKYNYLDIAGLMFHARKLNRPNRLICSEFCAKGLLYALGAQRVLNVLPEFAYLVTPETLHLSPLFVGHLVKKVNP